MKVYLDHDRKTPAGWQRTCSADEAIKLLETGRVQELSLSHDLGNDQLGTGYDVILWIKEAVLKREINQPPEIKIHAADLSVRMKMELAIKEIEKQATLNKSQTIEIDGIGKATVTVRTSADGFGPEQYSSEQHAFLERCYHINHRGKARFDADKWSAFFEAQDGIRLCGADLKHAYLPGIILKEADLFKINFSHAVLSNANLFEATMCAGKFEATILENAYLEDADLRYALVTNAKLQGANFMFSSSEGLYCKQSDLRKADFTGADLKKAYFINCDLEHACFDDSKLEAVNFQGANLTGANYLTVKQLSQTKTLFGAKLDASLAEELKKTNPELFVERIH